MLGSITFWTDLTEIYGQKTRIEAQNAAIAQTAVEVSQVAETIATASQQLSQQIAHSSEGAREQSGRVSDTANAVEEMNATILEVARSASATSENAEKAKLKAQDGARLVEEVSAAVQSIRNEAGQMTDSMLGVALSESQAQPKAEHALPPGRCLLWQPQGAVLA